MRHPVRILAWIAACAQLFAAFTGHSVAQSTGPSQASDNPLYAPVIDSIESDVLERTGDLSNYVVEATLTEATPGVNAIITGNVQIEYTNLTADVLNEIPFRLYANNAEYAEGSITVDEITVNNKPAKSIISVNDTLLTVDLPESVGDGESVELGLSFVTILPTDPSESYGMFKFDTDTNTYSLAHWLPLLAGWDEVYGWNTGPISINGDPVYTEAAVFDVNLQYPRDLVLVTSGSELASSTRDGITTGHFASGPSRDFVMTASTDFQVIEEVVGETTVRSYSWPGYENGSASVLQSGSQSLALYNELIGPYPYEELDIVQVDIGNGAGGVEFPGLVYIGSDFYSDTYDPGVPRFLEFIVVHEVAHQWFYNVIGNNQYQHAFLDESMANYLSIVYFAAQYGTEAAHEQANVQLRLGYFDMLFKEGDQVVDQPTDDFVTSRDYGITVYGKGALAFQQLRHLIGTDAFFDGLATYYEDFAFRIAQPNDMKAAFEASSGEDLTDFWTHWFESAKGEEDFDAADLARLLRELNE